MIPFNGQVRLIGDLRLYMWKYAYEWYWESVNHFRQTVVFGTCTLNDWGNFISSNSLGKNIGTEISFWITPDFWIIYCRTIGVLLYFNSLWSELQYILLYHCVCFRCIFVYICVYSCEYVHICVNSCVCVYMCTQTKYFLCCLIMETIVLYYSA